MSKNNKKKKKAEPTRFQKIKVEYKVEISNFKQRFPKWKYIALGAIAAIVITGITLGLVIGLQSSDEATTARNGDTVKVAYIGTYDNGSVFDSRNSSAPLGFTIGNRSTIPGFEKGVIGMSVNETKNIRMSPEDGYGPAELKVNINEFPEGVAIGQYYNHTLDNGVYIQSARVTAINESIVTLQNLTPMAGLYLNFEITLIELTKPTAEPTGNTSS